MPDLSGSTWDLQSSLQHLESSVVACGILFPDQGLNLGLSAMGAPSLSHWTTRDVPEEGFKSAIRCLALLSAPVVTVLFSQPFCKGMGHGDSERAGWGPGSDFGAHLLASWQ